MGHESWRDPETNENHEVVFQISGGQGCLADGGEGEGRPEHAVHVLVVQLTPVGVLVRLPDDVRQLLELELVRHATGFALQRDTHLLVHFLPTHKKA